MAGSQVGSATAPPRLTLAMELHVNVGAPLEVGPVPGQDVDPALVYFRTVPAFETQAPHLQWLTRAIFIGTGERHPSDVTVRVWKVE